MGIPSGLIFAGDGDTPEPDAEPEREWRLGLEMNSASLGALPAGLAWSLRATMWDRSNCATICVRNGMFKVEDVKPLPGYKLRLRYCDGAEGLVDLSHLAGKGVFAAWKRAEAFEAVSIGSSGEIRWGESIDLCPDALYMQLTGKFPEEVFPNLKKAGVSARD